jgi:putative ABC transport system substrate-binding protein
MGACALVRRAPRARMAEETRMTNRRRAALVWALAALCGSAASQGARRPARVGWLGWSGDTAPAPDLPLRAFREGLAEAGWREGQNLVLVQRLGDRDQAATLAAELMREHVDVVAAMGPMSILARQAVGATPLVFAINGDPVEAGLVSSLAQPGGGITGLTALSTELAGKRLEWLKVARPALSRVALLANDRHPGRVIEQQATLAAAQRLGLAAKYFALRAATDLDAVLAAIAAEPFGALLAFPDTLINRQARAIAEFSQQRKLPSISGWSEFALAGNLMSYGPRHAEYFRHVATYVDRILRGARPAALPVEQPTRIELVINQTAAKAIGLALPKSLVARADEVVG